jgi:signal transduction histidine kinase
MSARTLRIGTLGVGLVAATLVTVLVHNSLSWIGTTFPGFFVLENLVVPSIALPEWPDPSSLFQRQVVAIDGQPTAASSDVYAAVRTQPPGTPFHYTLRGADGRPTEMVMQSRIFSYSDYVLLFGFLLVSGCAFLLSGMLVFLLKPHDPASRALMSLGVGISIFAVTALDLYGPHWFFRLHVIGEVMLAPAFIHLALVFPTDRIWRHRRATLLGIYVPFVLFVAVYELVLRDAALYTTVHLIAVVAQALSGAAIIGAVSYDMLTTKSPLVRRRLAVVTLGTLSGFLIPTLLFAGSGLFGGRVAVNGAALTAFFFPLSLAYGIVKQDLFEIDVMLRRTMSYGVVVVAVAIVYFLALYVFGVLVPGQLSAWSPVVLAVVNFGLLFLIASLRERVQRAIDRVFYRQTYHVEEALSLLSQVLASAHAVDAVVRHTRRVLDTTVCPAHFETYLRGRDKRLRRAAYGSEKPLECDPGLEERLGRGEIVARYEWDDGSGRPLPAIWSALQAELLVPIRSMRGVIGLLVLGPKSSGRVYSEHDTALLRAASNQIGLALTNAAAFTELEELNTNLERKVHERTAALHESNAELNRSVEKLRQAYDKLEHSQASLLRTERLATLGRLTAGIAHEMNTPLSAVLNALKILKDLGDEYTSSVDDPGVLPEDHREIAAEITETAQAAANWAQKAAAYISSVKAHGRETRPVVRHRIVVGNVVAEARALLSHRLRVAAYQIDFEDEPQAVSLTGDPSRLSQVLLNLCTNAVDAYEDNGVTGARILVRAAHAGNTVQISVEDWAGGIPPAVRPHIFDELYTTKGPGRGTGLGLWIARNLVEQEFGGTLTVETVDGVGSRFTAMFPVSADDTQTASARATSATPVSPTPNIAVY